LRCLLLVLLAFVLAMPCFKKTAVNGKSKGWLLISKNDFKEAYQHYKPKADSLIKAGYEIHYFNSGFQKTTLVQALSDTTSFKTNAVIPYWSLVQQLNRTLPAVVPVYLITPNSLNNFEGNKPGTILKLHWLTYTIKDSTANWIQKASFTGRKDVRLVIGDSKPSGTVYHSDSITQGALENAPYVLIISKGKPFISLKNKSQKPVEIDTSTLKIDVFAGTNSTDARYVKAALESIGQYTQQNIAINDYNNTNKIKKDWLFWLTDKPVDNTAIRRYNNILVYEAGKVETVEGRVITGEEGFPSRDIHLYKSVVSKTHADENEWFNGYGNPLLTNELKGTTHLYHFYSRFNPSWNDLVWDASFPQIILQLIVPLNEYPGNTAFDKRIISDQQIRPYIIPEDSVTQSNDSLSIAMTHYFWLFLVSVFILERWLSYKNQPKR
jgi:hypothetical protein